MYKDNRVKKANDCSVVSAFMPAKDIADTPEIRYELDHLRDIAEALASAVEDLAQKIKPVLAAELPCEACDSAPLCGNTTPLGSELNGVKYRLAAVRDHIVNLIQRVAL